MAVEGREHLDAALAAGRGVILVLPHMGSWDVSAAYAASIGYPILAVADRFPGSLNDAVVESRWRFGMEVVPIGRPAVPKILERLKSNGIVALVCDLEQGPGVAVRFFGRTAIVPSGPASFAMKTGAVVLPIYQYATGPGRQQARIDSPVAVGAGDTKQSVMQRVIERFEGFIKEHPDQWYAFRPMFRR
jgi:KDO2-lipid IV(A) lauroyltransferase